MPVGARIPARRVLNATCAVAAEHSSIPVGLAAVRVVVFRIQAFVGIARHRRRAGHATTPIPIGPELHRPKLWAF